MAGQFLSPDGDLESAFVSDPAIIDQFAKTGSLWGWGFNFIGALGNNDSASQSSPVQTVATGTNWKMVACGRYHSSAIKTDGTLWGWGKNDTGQLGDGTVQGTNSGRSSPVQTAAASTTWKQVSAGQECTGAIKTDGTLWMWGKNNYGQLGDGTRTTRSSPVQIGENNWKIISCGGYATGAIKTDGTLWSWGYNSNGGLADNTVNNRSSPVQIYGGGTTWKQIDYGNYQGAAIKNDGTLWTWGNNYDGQLGNNSTEQKESPVQTATGGTNWKFVSSGMVLCQLLKLTVHYGLGEKILQAKPVTAQHQIDPLQHKLDLPLIGKW